jgi:hypothetical protein
MAMGASVPRSGLKCSFCNEGVNPEDAGVKDRKRKRVICRKCIQTFNDMSKRLREIIRPSARSSSQPLAVKQRI